MVSHLTASAPIAGDDTAAPRSILAIGEILWDRLPDAEILGGAPMNFAYRIAALGDRAAIVSRLGGDDLGRKASTTLSELGVDDRLVQWDDTHPTGVVDIEFDPAGVAKIDVRPNAAYDYIEPSSEALLAAEEADCICFGTVVQRNNVSRRTLGSLLDWAQKALKVLDINLRTNCFTREIVERALDRADILKLNAPEADALSRMFGLECSELQEFVRMVLARWPIRAVVVTLEGCGAFAATSAGKSVYSPGYRVPVVDTLGAGDAFTAGFVHQYIRGKTLAQSCRYGNALGALVAGQAGATAALSHSNIVKFLACPPPHCFDERLRGCFAEET